MSESEKMPASADIVMHEKDMKKNLYNRNIYYAENEDCISIHIPMRDLCLRDYIIYFDKTWV